jgi:hypothetical protein
LLYLGEFASARRLLAESLALADSNGLTQAAITAAMMIARSHFEEGELGAAKEWIARSESTPENNDQNGTGPSDLPLIRAQIGILEGRLSDQALTSFAECGYLADVQSFRFQSMAYGVRALAQLRRGEQIIDDAALEKAFGLASAAGGQDFSAYAMSEVHAHMGESEAASVLLRRYVDGRRREQSPLPPYLARALC